MQLSPVGDPNPGGFQPVDHDAVDRQLLGLKDLVDLANARIGHLERYIKELEQKRLRTEAENTLLRDMLTKKIRRFVEFELNDLGKSDIDKRLDAVMGEDNESV